VALLAAPVVWLALCSPFARNAPALPLAPWRAAVAGVMAAAALAIGFRQTGHAMPWLTNIVTPEGLGPFTLSDIAQWNLPAPENWLGVAWPLLCAWCMVAVLAGVSMLWAWPRAEGWLHTVRHTAAPTQFLVATALVYLAPLLLSGMFDRYLLPTLPVACALLLFRQPPRPAMVAATGLLVGMALASTVLVHDHFAWQRARWALIDHARHTLHVAEADLDGGFEHTWPQFYQHANAEQTAQGPVWAERRCTISFHGQRAGHTSVAQRAASTWATRGPTALHLLCRP
jgi:hypothetical protein